MAVRSAGNVVFANLEASRAFAHRVNTVREADHAGHPPSADANDVSVLGVKLVHQPPIGRRVMLRDFLDEGPVVEL